MTQKSDETHSDLPQGAVAISRRGNPVYDKNPFLKNVLSSTRIGTKKITNKAGDKMMIVSEQGEILAPAGFHEIVEVDKTQFVKLYINGVKAFQGLKNAGAKMFEVLYRFMQEQPGQDRINLHYSLIDQAVTPISRATYDRGITELLEKGFVVETPQAGLFFVNVDYIFNGNRLAFIREYRVKGTAKPADMERREQLEERGQQRLIQ